MNKRRKILAAMLAAFMLLVPMVSTAQIDIKGGDEETSDLSGTWGTVQITDYQTEEYVPLGEGLWLLAGAAGLYLLVKSRKTRKATAVAAAALALTLGTTQCKKTEESVIPAGETISISFMAGNGAKADIDVYTGRITWNAGDKVYVVCNNAAPSKDNNAVLLGGNLTAKTGGEQETEISGDVIVPEDYTLPENPSFTFYYVGKGVDFSSVAGSTNLTFDISSQNGIDAGHYMVGRTEAVEMQKDGSKYVPSEDGAKHFDPLTSVLRLDTKAFGAGQMTMDGGNSQMEIDLANPGTPVYNTGSSIMFSGDADARISVVPTTAPDVNANVTLNFSGNGKVGSITVKNGIKEGRIYSKVTNNAGYPIPVEAIGSDVLPGKFSVSADKYVQFSRGNLQATYNGSGYDWAFAANQYDYIGNASGNTTIKDDGSNDGGAVVDLFGWSAETTNYGINISTQNTSYIGDFKDWGTAPGLPSAGEGKSWRTLSEAEWYYLLNSRTDGLWAWKGLDDGAHPGLVILPDGTNPSVKDLITTTSDLATYNAVFLPAAGKRNGTTMEKVGEEGFYWPSTPNGDYAAYGVYFSSYGAGTGDSDRYYGYAVRLVQRFDKPIEPTFVDLGLPSGTLWATCNLGAEHPYDYGDYYQWGGVTPVTSTPINVGWENCPGNGGSSYYNETAFNEWKDDYLTNNVLNPEVDAATANWGGGCRMPTTGEWKELYDNTTNIWTTENGVAGRKFTSKKVGYTDRYIFLPAAGYRSKAILDYVGSYGHYWSGSLNSSDPSCACYMQFHSDGVDPQLNFYRRIGYSVRPVRAAPN